MVDWFCVPGGGAVSRFGSRSLAERSGEWRRKLGLLGAQDGRVERSARSLHGVDNHWNLRVRLVRTFFRR